MNQKSHSLRNALGLGLWLSFGAAGICLAGYLDTIGPAPLRFLPPPKLPPVIVPEPATHHFSSGDLSLDNVGQIANLPAIRLAQPNAPESAPAVIVPAPTPATPSVSPDALVEMFRQALTNQPPAALGTPAPFNFMPPRPSSHATYISQ